MNSKFLSRVIYYYVSVWMNSNSKYCSLGFYVKCEHMSIDIKVYATLQRIYIDKFFAFDFIFFFLYYTLKISTDYIRRSSNVRHFMLPCKAFLIYSAYLYIILTYLSYTRITGYMYNDYAKVSVCLCFF